MVNGRLRLTVYKCVTYYMIISRAEEKAGSRVDEHTHPHWVISKLEKSVCYCPVECMNIIKVIIILF